MKRSILDIEVSCFANYRETKNPKMVNLITWLTSEKYRIKVEEIRKTNLKEKRDELKATLPAITPSGVFSERRESGLISHSGLIQIDIDRQENLHIANWDDLKQELIKLPELAYVGKSVSGQGYWGLIPIPTDPLNHKHYFQSISDRFEIWSIQLDSKPKNVSSLRGYSFDDEGYFNHNALSYSRLEHPESPKIRSRLSFNKNDLLDWLQHKINEALPGDRHNNRLRIGRLAGGYMASGLIPLDSGDLLIQSYLNVYGNSDSELVQRKEIIAIKQGIEYGLNHPIE